MWNWWPGRGIAPLYAPRVIRSIYFDRPGFQIFKDSEEGVLPRKKPRIRTYPEANETSYNPETKFSSVEGRYKMSEPVSQDRLLVLYASGLLDPLYGLCLSVLVVSYVREYFLLETTKITFDSRITYKDFSGFRRGFEDSCVAEIKGRVRHKRRFPAPTDPFAATAFFKIRQRNQPAFPR